ncbi:Vitamin B12-binding protein [Pseudoprimorskyibacter insulae]|uniref:Vitamin B12-binding protein n=2 Tax=Pseudoprimorskyibacter insulae TaxID=1695997 RepID=A0A2R8AR91_9RHOB|nr:Vitamin B12-binding protein [Pseudoprimorskyibacter insulae]
MVLMLAEPEQIASLSLLAKDARTSVYADRAAPYPTNTGKAEEVALLAPDLVLAGTYTTRATVQMLEKLGYRLEIFPPINSLAEARANILRMGDILGQPDRAADIVAAMDVRLDALTEEVTHRPLTAFYHARGNTTGTEGLQGEMMTAAGMENIAAMLDLPYGGSLPLEKLVMETPDLILIGPPYSGHSQATELLEHPVLVNSGKRHVLTAGAAWVCETPALLDALAELVATRKSWEAAQ